MPDPRRSSLSILRVQGAERRTESDEVAVERPLEIGVGGRPLAVTLRTPGDDRELTLGFLAGEGIIRSADQVAALQLAPGACDDEPDRADVTLAPGVALDWSKLERHFAASSACGLCGRAHLESLRAGLERLPFGDPIHIERLYDLPQRASAAQSTFRATGGLHAAVYASGAELKIEALFEDVGRHNAVDKNAGHLLLRGAYPAAGGVLWVSGRAGAEIVLKAARARVPVLAAVGAPTTLAVELAISAGMTLIGFLRDRRMNVYCGAERLASE